MTNLHLNLWAKSRDEYHKHQGEPLVTHSIQAALTARQICYSLPFPKVEREALAEILVEACAYHDLGKAASGFQRMLRTPANRWGHRHETLSTVLAFALNPTLDPCARFAILTHHKSIPSDGMTEKEKCLPWEELPPDFGALSEVTWKMMLQELKENWEELGDLLIKLALAMKLKQLPLERNALLVEFGIESAWLKREVRYQRKISPEQKLRASLMRGILITSDHLASAYDPQTGRHIRPLPIPRLADYASRILACELPPGLSPLPFQKRAGNIQQDVILKAPTGSGKTLAALLWATQNQSENGRFFYVLPYTASINAMTDRLKKIFDQETKQQRSLVGVLHHRNADYLFRAMEEDLPQRRNKSARLLSGLAREMYHPIRVCTPHQILRFALCGRGWETGIAEFTNACFVFDEVHAFEPLLAGLTLATVRLLQRMGAHVLFTSATIPRFLENEIKEKVGILDECVIAPDPLNEEDALVCGKIRHRIEVRGGNVLDGLWQVMDEIEESGDTALIVCNHVATSQAVWRRVNDDYGIPAMLLHSRFNGRDRSRIERAITSDDKPRILVATQAVEVSLDIDYNRGYTEPAPVDALGQRFGRINRKGKRPSPAPIVLFEEPAGGYLYDQELTDRTVNLFRQMGELTEANLVELVDAVYADGYTGASAQDFQRGIEHPLINNFQQEIIPGTHRSWTDDILDSSDGQIEVLPDCLLEEFKELRKGQRYVEADQLLVPIRLGQKFKAEKMGVLFYDKSLREFITTLRYSSESGLDLSSQSDNIF